MTASIVQDYSMEHLQKSIYTVMWTIIARVLVATSNSKHGLLYYGNG
jgi:hypothetical protein